jgi:thioredoxin reductase (NADPH)
MRNVIIIGGGAAGLTAAVYAARAAMNPLVIEGLQPGGQLTITSDVENFPGFPEGISGPELMDRIRAQAQRFGSEHLFDLVSRVDLQSNPKRVWVGEDLHEAHSVIVATGATARWLGLESEQRLQGRGVSACATCDGFFFRDQDIAVVGGGDTALEEATFLTRFARSVTVIHRRDELRASPIMREKAEKNSKVRFIWYSVVKEILGDDAVTGLVLEDVRTGKTSTLDVTGVFMAIGHVPATELFRGQLDLDPQGYIVLKDRTGVGIPGVFAAGDVADRHYRQAISAAGSGCMAAIDAQHYVESLLG